MSKILGLLVAIAAVVAAVLLLSGKDNPNEVVCYTALDMEFSKPLLEKFEKDTGIKVLMKFDAESTKTIGLVNSLIAEKEHPRCDVFWNNEIVNTIRLKKEGLLEEFHPQAARGFPDEFRDPDGMWTGFAARARVLLVNTDLVKPEEMPKRLEDLLNPKWKGKIGVAKPLFGSTATWVATLFAASKSGNSPGAGQLETLGTLAKERYLRVVNGNKASAQSVSGGNLAMAFTDTDDAIGEKEAGKPVALVYLDGDKDGAGTLFFPNTLSLVKGCPHGRNARKLIEYLLSPEVEKALAESESAQIPVNSAVETAPRVATPKIVKPMLVDWDAVADVFKESEDWVKQTFVE